MSTITLNPEKCVGCNSCVRVCPTHEANVAHADENGKIIISINDEKCIKCGECIRVCSHEARDYNDDTEQFFDDLKRGERITLIAAPAIKIAFDGNWRNVLKWFKENGCSHIFDVSMGADICTWAHVKLIKSGRAKKVISQPCAAITNFILKFRPKLLNRLSPVQSPMLCTAQYIKKYTNSSEKIAALSPCIAKKDEFTQTGLVKYNVTFKKMKDYFAKHNIKFPLDNGNSAFEFDFMQGLIGSIYPQPGGLKYNLERHLGNSVTILTSEGPDKVYEDLVAYEQQKESSLPNVFDVLNCEFGCNGGPAVGQAYSPFQMHNVMCNVQNFTSQKRTKEQSFGKDKQFKRFDKTLNVEDFLREYTAFASAPQQVSESAIEQAFITLKKPSQSDREYNCHACGFSTCQKMARAVAMGLNIPESCSQYSRKLAEEERQKVTNMNHDVELLTRELSSVFDNFSGDITNVHMEVENIDHLNELNQTDMSNIGKNISELTKCSDAILEAMNRIDLGIDGYTVMTKNVSDIARQINLLSVNASIEAAHVGALGKGFGVVAEEVGTLAKSSQLAVNSANQTNEEVVSAIKQITEIVGKVTAVISVLREKVDQMSVGIATTSSSGKSISSSMLGIDRKSERVQQMIVEANDRLHE